MATVDDRLRSLEVELTSLREQFARHLDSLPEGCDLNWIERIAGSFHNEPEFDVVLQLGQEERRREVTVDSKSSDR